MPVSILILEDDPHARALLSQVLEEEGYGVAASETLAAARAALGKGSFDLLILDRTLPDGDGLELCSELRSGGSQDPPILFLSARHSVEEKIEGLRGGADDYLPKPFSAAELLARIEAVLRRSGKLGAPETLESGEFRLDLAARKAFYKGKELELWAKEFDLLALLAAQQGRVLSREFLLQQNWNYAPGQTPETKVVDVTISHLRDRLGPAAAKKIVTVRGYGYRLDP